MNRSLLLSCDAVSKAYGTRSLFEGLSFGLFEADVGDAHCSSWPVAGRPSEKPRIAFAIVRTIATNSGAKRTSGGRGYGNGTSIAAPRHRLCL